MEWIKTSTLIVNVHWKSIHSHNFYSSNKIGKVICQDIGNKNLKSICYKHAEYRKIVSSETSLGKSGKA
jgi:hypothetical protein